MNEPNQNREIPGVQVLFVFDSLGCLQDHGQIAEARIVDQVAKRLEPHLPYANTGMAVDAAAASPNAVVQMPDTQISKSHGPSQPVDRFIVLVARPQ